MPRKGGGEGKYRSRNTGRFVSAHYGKRNPKHAYRVDEEGDDSRQEIPLNKTPPHLRSVAPQGMQ